METARRDLISRPYHAALERPPAERVAFLELACEADPALQQEIESLLRNTSGATGFLEASAAEIVTKGLAERASIVGRQLGPYQLFAPLGAGGMGEVYRAHDTKLGRDVAIKILPAHFHQSSATAHR